MSKAPPFVRSFVVTWTLAAPLLVVGCRTPHGEALPPEAVDVSADTEGAVPAFRGPAAPVVLRGGRVMTATGTIHESADVYVKEGRIAAVGPNLDVPQGTTEIDVRGKTVTPGIIDTHSHIGVYAAPGLRAHSDGNEAVAPVTAYADTRSAYWPQDPQIDTARAGGVTSMLILPGSANLIGGRAFVAKLIPGVRYSEDARFPGAPFSLKMACGENPKRVYGEKGGPQTRMGNLAGQRKAFREAVEYRTKWQRFKEDLETWERKQAAKARATNTPTSRGTAAPPEDPQVGERSGEALARRRNNHGNSNGEARTTHEGHGSGSEGRPAAGVESGSNGASRDANRAPEPPSKDEGLETLADVLNGKILVQNHCYRADEMLLMLDLAKEFGFHIRSFHHAVEAYKIADRLATSGTAASVWADWWGFKAEAYDGVRENAAMLEVAGARAVIHSDDPFGIQRLNQEAGKAMFAGRKAGFEISEDQALRWITANPAWVIGVEAQTGTLEPGKMADLVVWNGSPFSVYAKAERVYIDGHLDYDRSDARNRPRTDFDLGMVPIDATPASAASPKEAATGGSR